MPQTAHPTTHLLSSRHRACVAARASREAPDANLEGVRRWLLEDAKDTDEVPIFGCSFDGQSSSFSVHNAPTIDELQLAQPNLAIFLGQKCLLIGRNDDYL